MLFNAHKALTNFDNDELRDENNNVITLGTIAVNALDHPNENQKMSAEEKLMRYSLQQKLWKSKEAVKISTEEASLIKQSVAACSHYPPLFLGRITEEIEKD